MQRQIRDERVKSSGRFSPVPLRCQRSRATIHGWCAAVGVAALFAVALAACGDASMSRRPDGSVESVPPDTLTPDEEDVLFFGNCFKEEEDSALRQQVFDLHLRFHELDHLVRAKPLRETVAPDALAVALRLAEDLDDPLRQVHDPVVRDT